MKSSLFITVVLILASLGCRSQSPKEAQPLEPSIAYRELLHWEIPPSPEGQSHGLQGIAVGDNTEVFVADAEGRRIVVCSSEGMILREIRPPKRPAGLLQMPMGLLYDGHGRLYVTDFEADQVQVFTPDGKFLFRWGREGAGRGEFKAPVDIAQDQQGDLYVVEFYNHRVQKFTREGKFLLTWGSEGDWDRRNSPDQPPDKMIYPAGIAVGPDGNVFVADSGRDRIKVFSPEGKFVRESGSKSPEPGKFTALAGICFDAAGRLHVADMGAHRVQMFTRDASFLAAWTLPDAARQKINSPTKLRAHQNKFLFVSDVASNRIYKLQIEEGQGP